MDQYSLLLLLATVISQCGATEYYVRPTEPTNTSCPGQPCLTLNQYIENSSSYILSNVMFKFLPGKHVIKRPLEIRNIQNVTLKGISNTSDEYPQIVAQFSCWNNYLCFNATGRLMALLNDISLEDCSVIELINASHVNIRGIHLALSTVNVSAIKVEKSMDIHSVKAGQDINGYNIGIRVNKTNNLYVDKLHASNLLYGLLLHNTLNAHINESTFEYSGLLAMKSDSVHIKSTNVSANKEAGVELHFCNNTNIVNISAANNSGSGVVFTSCRNTSIVNISAANNNGSGVVFTSCRNTSIITAFATNNTEDGIDLQSCHETNITNLSVTENQGTGMYLLFCRNTTITNTLAASNQGGIILVSCNSTNISNASTTNNQWNGIGLYNCRITHIMNVNASKNQQEGLYLNKCRNIIVVCVYLTYNQNYGIMISLTSNISLRNVSVNNNGYAGISILPLSQLQLEDSVFSDVVPLSSPSVVTGLQTVPAIIEVINSSLIVTNCNFTRNNITSIRAVDSNVTLQGDIIFANNQALVGAALHFSQSSVLVISETGSVIFENNYAINYGGAVYIVTEESYALSASLQNILDVALLVTTSTRCFIHVEGDRSQARLIFVNNTAGRGGDVVYGGLVALGYDGDWNCLQSFKNVSDMSQQNDLSVISSAPSRVCLCQNDHFEHPDDCLTVADPHTYSVYPGETITLPAVVVGQEFGTVTGSAIAQFLPKPYTTCFIDLAKGQQTSQVSKNNCENLNYTLYTKHENCTAILVINTDNSKVLTPMTLENNHKVNKSWKILNKNPNYHELASYLISELNAEYNATPSGDHTELSMHTIQNFLKFTPRVTCYLNFTCAPDKFAKLVFP